MTRKTNWTITALVAALGLGGLAATQAKADWRDRHDGWRREEYRRDWHRDRGGWDLNIGEVYAPPCETTTTERVWVEPVYRTVCDRVWVDPIYRNDCTRVWVPPVIEQRASVCWEHGRRMVRYENVEVAPGHYEERREQVVVSEGHWQNVERTEVVCAGHWEERVVTVAAPPRPVGYGFNFNIRGR